MKSARHLLENQLVERAWADENFRTDLKTNPKSVIEKMIGQALPLGIEIKVVEETADMLYLRIPFNPDNLPDEMLDKVTGGEWDGSPCDNDQYKEACWSKGT